jgi:acyl carrier protein
MDAALLEQLKDEIRDFLATIGPVSSTEMNDYDPLIDQGIVDSLGLVELQLFLEEKLGREFFPGELADDTLLTIDSAARWLISKHGLQVPQQGA